MKITRKIAAKKLIDYLQHLIRLKELVDWTEWAMMEHEFIEQYLLHLGYQVKISVVPKVS